MWLPVFSKTQTMAHDSCLPACVSHCTAVHGAYNVGDAWGVQELQERSVIVVAKSASAALLLLNSLNVFLFLRLQVIPQ